MDHREVGRYWDESAHAWTTLASAAPTEARAGLRDFRTPRFTHTLSQWFHLLLGTGFVLECIQEPRPGDEAVRAHPNLQDAQVVPCFLHVRVRKPPARCCPAIGRG